jgi:L-lactate dehydrogenase complex protein LldE
MKSKNGGAMRVGLFVTCLVDLMRPEIGFASLHLLEAAGFDVVVPQQQTCCGQPAFNSGESTHARALAEKMLIEFEAFDYVVLPSGSCAGMIKIHYRELFAHEAQLLARWQAMAERVFELASFLHRFATLPDLPLQGAAPACVTYHDSCSGLRELGIVDQPRALLARVAGLNLREMDDCRACCGFGGTFAVKFGAISSAIADEKCQHIADSGAQAVVLGDLGCMLHIEGRLRRRGDRQTRVLHIAQVLAGQE